MRVIDLDMLDYRSAWKRQEEVHTEVLGGAEESILLVEHPPTITYGRRAQDSAQHLLATPQQLVNMHVEVVPSDRGGDITFHGPGQIVAYPIIRLESHGLSIGAYMKQLQQAVVDTLAAFHVEGKLEPASPGVWCPDAAHDGKLAKVAAVGVRVRRGVTMHGLALNVEPDLAFFDLIIPCGLQRPVTSLHRLLGSRAPSVEAVKEVLVRSLVGRFSASAEATC